MVDVAKGASGRSQTGTYQTENATVMLESQSWRLGKADLYPVAGGDVINAVLYVAENGCKWRALSSKFGNWHTIYTRLRRWAEAGVLDRLFTALQVRRLIRIRVECLGLDSTSVKVHPDGTEAPKKGAASHWEISWRMEHQDPSGCRGCSNSPDIQSFRRPGP